MVKKIHIELEEIRRLAGLQCTLSEAAAFLGLKPRKLKQIMEDHEDIQDAWDEGQQLGKISLRRKQLRLAGSSASMAIHLGKNMLGQKDAQSVEHTGKDGGPIESLDFSQLDANERTKLREILLRSRKSGAAPTSS